MTDYEGIRDPEAQRIAKNARARELRRERATPEYQARELARAEIMRQYDEPLRRAGAHYYGLLDRRERALLKIDNPELAARRALIREESRRNSKNAYRRTPEQRQHLRAYMAAYRARKRA